MNPTQNPPFRLCLTMAGAVSAGAYTAGVMDYLLETLELWQQAKDRNRKIREEYPNDYRTRGYDESIPMHDVVIEVLAGASAGGITSTLTLVSLLDKLHFYKKGDSDHNAKNKLYSSWVTMADRPGADTMSMLLSTEDLQGKGHQPVESLLNTQVVDQIADHILQIDGYQKYPAYIAPDLDLLLTISNLRGIGFEIQFAESSNRPFHLTTHAGFFRYRLKDQEEDDLELGSLRELYHELDLRDEDDRDELKNAALSTAAFPIGLRARRNRVAKHYIKKYHEYLFPDNQGVTLDMPEEDSGVYEFLAVDGGLINNEPLGYTMRILRDKHPENLGQEGERSLTEPNTTTPEQPSRYAILMIDPFPNHDESVHEQIKTSDIFSVAGRLIHALRNQAMFRQDDILDALSERSDTRFLIAPRKRSEDGGKLYQSPLASGAIGGFAGFMDRRLREHDFELGRRNCQSFLGYHFRVKASNANAKLNAELTDAARERFQFYDRKGEPDSGYCFPIIPDVRIRIAVTTEYFDDEQGQTHNLYQRDLPYPQLNFSDFERTYRKQIIRRLRAIAYNLIDRKWYRMVMRSPVGGLLVRRYLYKNNIRKYLKDQFRPRSKASDNSTYA